MIAVDSNVLVYAHRAEMPKHRAARKRLASISEGDAPWGIPVFCIGEFLRIVTHRKVFHPPSELAVALDAIDGLLESDSVRLLSPGSRFPALFREAVEVADARGNLVFDAQIAAVCQERGATQLLTDDKDFARFPALTVQSL